MRLLEILVRRVFHSIRFEITELDEIQIEYVEIDALSTPFLSLTLYNCGYDNGIEINELNAGVIYNSDAACEYGASEYLNSYGRLYNWYAVDDARGLCPSGWHVPTDEEFMTLRWNWDERIGGERYRLARH